MPKIPLAVIDFETLRIEPRPDYPPEPVGLAVLEPGKRPVYLAWGHPLKNNCTFDDAYKTLHRIYERYCVVMHNAVFDLEVAEKFFDLPLVPPHGFCDTMLEAFLYNPRFPDMKLKNLADNLLGMPPVEEQRLHEWILSHVFTSQKSGKGSIKIWDHRPKGLYAIPPSQAGGFIGYAPGDLVGRYAKGDVVRTKKLHNLFMPKIKKLGMMEQWDVEHRVSIKALEMSRSGVRIDVDNLAPDLETAKKKLATAERNVYKKLGEINLNSPKQKIEAFESRGLVSEWEYTDKGNPKTSIDSLMRVCTDKKLVKDLNIYSKYTKIIGTYMQPWLASALKNNGYFYPWYNTIKGENDRGTYTGRFSSNFQQVPRRVEDVSLKGLPFLRNYVIADKKSHVLFNRDFCFSDDTEVLTDRGWMLFKDLGKNELVAQYKNGVISYAKPLAYQKERFTGKMVHIHSPKSCNMLVSPDHQCLQLDYNNRPVKIRAVGYRLGHYKQVVSGIVKNKQSIDISIDLLKLSVAIQADGKILFQNTGVKISFYLKKERKIKRLEALLNALDIPYIKKAMVSKKGFFSFLFYMPDDVNKILDTGTKQFKRSLLKLSYENRLLFLKELGYWDGSIIGESWQYFNTNLASFDLLQEMCVITGVKSVLKYMKRDEVRKCCGLLYMTVKHAVDTKMFSKDFVEYDGYMYCVTMPQGTVIVRRGGNAFITGQCGQEVRILAHFEDGVLLSAFNKDPELDGHSFVNDLVTELTGIDYGRSAIKACNFLIIYGGGVYALSQNLGISYDQADEIYKAHGDALVGLGELKNELRLLARRGEMFKTAGGRWYDFEEGFEYVALNTLIQGSAADHSKRALLNISDMIETKGYDARLILTVHDEFMISGPARCKKKFMTDFREAMEYDELFDLPMLTDGKIGKCWGKMEKVNY